MESFPEALHRPLSIGVDGDLLVDWYRRDFNCFTNIKSSFLLSEERLVLTTLLLKVENIRSFPHMAARITENSNDAGKLISLNPMDNSHRAVLFMVFEVQVSQVSL